MEIDTEEMNSDVYSTLNASYCDLTDPNRLISLLYYKSKTCLRFIDLKVKADSAETKEMFSNMVNLKDISLPHDWKLQILVTSKSRYLVFFERKNMFNNMNTGSKTIYYVDPYKNEIIGTIDMPTIPKLGMDFHNPVILIPESDDILVLIKNDESSNKVFVVKLDSNTLELKYEVIETYDKDIEWIEMTFNIIIVTFNDHIELCKYNKNYCRLEPFRIINKANVKQCRFSLNGDRLLLFTIDKELSVIEFQNNGGNNHKEIASLELVLLNDAQRTVMSNNYVSVTIINTVHTHKTISFQLI